MVDHHAQLLIGSREWGVAQLPEPYRVTGIDTSHAFFDRMHVDAVRSLIYEASLRPVSQEKRVFVVFAMGILREAQHALLKLLEEPPATSLFYVIIPREDILIPTLRSRFYVLGKEYSSFSRSVFEVFQKQSYAERIATIAHKLKSDEDDGWVENLLAGFENYARKTRRAALMRPLLEVERDIRMVGSSRKMLLEHLALLL